MRKDIARQHEKEAYGGVTVADEILHDAGSRGKRLSAEVIDHNINCSEESEGRKHRDVASSDEAVRRSDGGIQNFFIRLGFRDSTASIAARTTVPAPTAEVRNVL